MALILSNGKRELQIEPIWTNVAGTLGFYGEASRLFDLSRLGALITNPISLTPRIPAHPPRILRFAGGFLLHTGHPNPGLSQVIRQYGRTWKELPCPVIAHLLGQDPRELAQMAERLEEVESITAIEVGLIESDPESVLQLLTPAIRSEVPVIANFPLNSDLACLRTAAESGAVAISLGPGRGSLPAPDGQLVHGRLFGPALFPFAAEAVFKLSSILEIPILASGGIYNTQQAKAMLNAGAKAVQLDSVLWTEPENILGDQMQEQIKNENRG